MGQSGFELELLKQLPMVRRFAFSLCKRADLADDLMQETAMRALSHQGSFDGANMAAWLCTICRNTYRSLWRDTRREEPLTDITAGNTAANTPSAETACDAKIALQKTITALDGRLPLVLALIDDLSYEELAIKFHVPAGTIKSRVHRMRSYAREVIDRDLPVPPVQAKPKKYKRTKKWILSAAERSARVKAGLAKAKIGRAHV